MTYDAEAVASISNPNNNAPKRPIQSIEVQGVAASNAYGLERAQGWGLV